MNLHCPFVCDTPELFGLPAEPSPVGFIALTGALGTRFTMTADAAYAELLLDALVGLSGPLALSAEAFGLCRLGWMTDWPEASYADVSAWVPASNALAAESVGYL